MHRAKFLAMRCIEKGNMHKFLEGLQVKKEKFVQVGVVIDNEDYLSTMQGVI